MVDSIGIVGAGVAGLGVAYALRNEAVDVQVFEAHDTIGGRVATEHRNGCVFDTGANYVKPTGGRTETVLKALRRDGLHDIDAPVYTFDGDGSVEPGDRPDAAKWSYESGLIELPRRLAAVSTAETHSDVPILELEPRDESWTLATTDSNHGPFDAVVLTPPAPTTADLLPGTGRFQRIRSQLSALSFSSVRTLVLHYPFSLDRPYYALLDATGSAPVGWIGREREKPGHVPNGEELLVVQMGPDWTRANRDRSAKEAGAVAADQAARLLDSDRLRDPDWVEDYEWRDALPTEGIDEAALDSAASRGIYLAGDWIAGKGRVGLALESGLAVGRRIQTD